MILVYRKHKDSLDLDWHFHSQCLRWPQTDFIQTRFIRPNESERFCEDCAKLESKLSSLYVTLPLRDHPQLNFLGHPSWPPIWVHTRTHPNKRIVGELGMFTGTILYEHAPTRLYVKMEFNREPYRGCLSLLDAVFSHQLHSFLQSHIGLTIKEIGNLDLSRKF